MNTPFGLERCLSFINCQLQPARGETDVLAPKDQQRWRAITISRQTGSGAHAVAERLAGYLEAAAPKGACPWAVFDRELVDRVLDEHHLPRNLARFMPEDRVSLLEEGLDELCGLSPTVSTLVQKTSETIFRLAELGNVILIGRGANIITNSLDHVFHVRLIAPLDKRVEYLCQTQGFNRKAALDFIRSEDNGRQRYLKTYFGKDVDDLSLYHLVINTDRVGHEETARLLAHTLRPGHCSLIVH